MEAAKNEINVMQNSGFAGKYPCFTNLHVILIGIFSPKLLSEKLTDKADFFLNSIITTGSIGH